MKKANTLLIDFVPMKSRLKKSNTSIWEKEVTSEEVDMVLSTVMIALVMFSLSATVGFYQNVLSNLN